MKGEPGNFNGVLLYELQNAEQAYKGAGGRDIWKRVAQNKDDRYHFLQEVAPEFDLLTTGLPEMVIDFKRYFTISPKDLVRQCGADSHEQAKRRCRLEMPYREHLQNRIGYYLQRVGLPEPHYSAP